MAVLSVHTAIFGRITNWLHASAHPLRVSSDGTDATQIGGANVYLVQLLLPVRDGSGHPYPRPLYDTLANDLTERFGGVTAYTRAPATGLWEAESGRKIRDDMVIYEVMATQLDEPWWAAVRARLERQFQQEELVVRAQEIRRL